MSSRDTKADKPLISRGARGDGGRAVRAGWGTQVGPVRDGDELELGDAPAVQG